MSIVANWSYPTAIRFGAGRISEIGEACAAAGIKKPLLITDRGLAKMDITTRALDLLEAAGLGRALFADVDPNPNEKNAAAGVAAFKEGGHDGVVAFGGGSGLDLGKLVAFLAGQTRPLWDFEDIGDWWTRADADAIAPIVAVPTTAGTGSEVGRASVITNSITEEKKIIFHPKFLPSVVICDPELTVGMPKFITALVKTFLPRAYADGSDLEARAHMMSAAAMGATAFQKGLGAIHALSHPIGAMYHTHHGTTNAVCMPAVLQFNKTAIEEKLSAAANYLNIQGGFDGFCAFVDDLNASLQIPKSLTALGIADIDIDRVVAGALSDPSTGGNPVEMTPENTRKLLLACC